MVGLRRSIIISIFLGLLSVLAILFCSLALADVAHGESDLTNEWMAGWLSFAAIFIFTAFSVITLVRLLKARQA
jgi:hypothetical protein